MEEFEDSEGILPKKFGNVTTKEEYADKKFQFLKEKIEQNLEGQKNELKTYYIPTKEDCILYRAVGSEMPTTNYNHHRDFRIMLNNLTPGDKTILDGGAMCTSGNIGIASQYGNTFLRIKAPKGSRLAKEALETRFPSFAEFKYVGKNEFNGVEFLDFEYILPNLD